MVQENSRLYILNPESTFHIQWFDPGLELHITTYTGLLRWNFIPNYIILITMDMDDLSSPSFHFFDELPNFDLLNHGLLSSAATADMKLDRRCSKSCTLHSASTRESLVCASSSSSSFIRWSLSSILMLVLKPLVFSPDCSSPSPVNRREQFEHEPILLCKW